MKYKIVVSVLIFLLPAITNCQNIPGVTIKRERNFTGKSLYGFMNGGADLYLEYGVRSLVVRDVEYKGEEFTIEIYEMSTAADAFGIYSLNVFKCQRADSLGCFDCLSPYQLQLATGNKYIAVVFNSGSAAAKNAVDELIRFYVNIDESEKLVIPGSLNLTSPFSGNLKYLRGKLSVSNAESSLLPVIENIPFSGIWLVNDQSTAKETKALIELNNSEDAIRLKERVAAADIIESNKTSIYIKIQEKEVDKKDLGPFGF